MMLWINARAAGAALGVTICLLFLSAYPLWAQLPDSSLAIQLKGDRVVWWNSANAPQEWPHAIPAVTKAVQWHSCRQGLEYGLLDLRGKHVGWHITVVLARLNPSKFRLRLQSAVKDASPAWNIDSMPDFAALGVNAGQFELDRPWGWIVQDGRELQPPRSGPLSSALVVDHKGKVTIVDAVALADARKRSDIWQAFQSYPTILTGKGRVPEQLLASGRGVDLDHRDSRLALGILEGGNLLIALTRFAGADSILSQLPFGPTTPEMAAIMGALGCRRAMLLDGGLSGQLAIRDDRKEIHRLPGLRSVPLGLLAIPNSLSGQ
jgi:hypothetical protein